MADFRKLSAKATRGCVVLERPDLVKALVEKHGAKDTTARGTAMRELDEMTASQSQWLPGEEIPERHWMYRLAKRFWFNDFRAYEHLEKAQSSLTNIKNMNDQKHHNDHKDQDDHKDHNDHQKSRQGKGFTS